MSNSRLTSGRVLKTPSIQVTADRYQYLGLNQAEPDLGVSASDGQVLTSSTTGTRSFVTADLQFIADSGAPSTTALITHVTGNLTGNVIGNVTGTTSDISNHDTDTLTEGTSNLYFTTDRARSSFTAGTGITINNGVIDVGQQVSPTDNVSFNNVTVNGLLNSDDITGTNIEATGNVTITGNLTVLGTSTAQNVNNVNITNLTITVADGATDAEEANGGGLVVDGADASILYSYVQDKFVFNKGLRSDSGFTGPLIGDVMALDGTSTVLDSGTDGSNATFTGNVTGQVSDVSNHSTDVLTEGSTNLYYTDARVNSAFDNRLATKSTDDVAEGSNNLYFTTARAIAAVGGADTDAIVEGSTNLYFTTARVDAHLSGGTGVTYNAGTISIGQSVGTTDNPTFNRVTASEFVGNISATTGTTVVNNITVTGNVTGDVVGDVTGAVTGTLKGNIIANNGTTILTNGTNGGDASFTGIVSGDVTGDLTGDVTGNLTGNVTGDVTGNVTGDVKATDGTIVLENGTNGTNATFVGSVTGNLTGNVTGDLTGDVTGDTTGTHTGAVVGDVTGDLTGDVTGNVAGDTTGTHTGAVVGDLTGDVTGNVAGDLTGDVTGTVSDISNHSTDVLTEGSTNLYYTDARAESAAQNKINELDLSPNAQLSYTIGVNGSSAYTFTGPGFPTASNNPDIILLRGVKYQFDNTANYTNHPFKIRVSNSGADYTDGVTTTNGVTEFIVPYDAPNSLVYQCSVHGGMVGNFTILSQGGGALNDLTDVSIGTPSNGQALVWNSATSQWEAATPGNPPFTEVTSNTVLQSGGQYLVNSSSAPITVTLPVTANIGEEIVVVDGTGTAATNNITIDRNGNKIQGLAENLIIDSSRAAFTLIYYNTANGWLFKDN